jgi:hypothetical protein
MVIFLSFLCNLFPYFVYLKVAFGKATEEDDPIYGGSARKSDPSLNFHNSLPINEQELDEEAARELKQAVEGKRK